MSGEIEEQVGQGHDCSAAVRDRHTARSLVKVAMERLPGSVKIFLKKARNSNYRIKEVVSDVNQFTGEKSV